MFRKAFSSRFGPRRPLPRAAFPQATIPSTPAGQTLQAWLTAFNSGDRAQMDAYCPQIRPQRLDSIA